MRKPCARSARAISASVPSPARKPGTSSTGSPRRDAGALGVRRLAAGPPVSGGPEREPADLDDRAALAQHRRRPRGRRSPPAAGSRPGRWCACDPRYGVADGSGFRRICPSSVRTRLLRHRTGGWLTGPVPCPTHDEPAPCAVSEELFAPVGRGIELCYQTFGDPDDDPLLLVMGLGGPMTWWDAELCADAGPSRLLRDPLRQPRHRPLDACSTPGSPARRWCGPSPARRCGRRTALERPGRRRLRAARPPRPGVRARRRGVDGRDDRADDGDRAARAGCGR